MKKFKIFYILSLTIFLLLSCSKEIKLENIGFEKSFKIAKEKFNENNFREAINDLNTIVLNYGGENGIDSAQFLIGKSHYQLEEYYSAAYEFTKLSESFPESQLIEDSYFNSAECYRELSPRYTLDQKETFTAISKYQLYLDLFPKGKFALQAGENIKELRVKIARKNYEAGLLYLKLDQPRAAKVYFNEIIDNFYDTSFYLSSLEQIAYASLAMKDEYNYQLYLSKFQELKNNVDNDK